MGRQLLYFPHYSVESVSPSTEEGVHVPVCLYLLIVLRTNQPRQTHCILIDALKRLLFVIVTMQVSCGVCRLKRKQVQMYLL